ncbi:hypothetical protein HRbin30_00105 [bacterium HR30]|nr:hypothetical protein HRbin30_00105 [bacterium HR30]
MSLHLDSRKSPSQRNRARSLALLAALCGALFAPGAPEAKGPCEEGGVGQVYIVPVVGVRTEVSDIRGQKAGKREVAPGEFTELCVGLRLATPDEWATYMSQATIKVAEPGLGFSQAHCRKKGRDWPCAASYDLGPWPTPGEILGPPHVVQPPPDPVYDTLRRAACPARRGGLLCNELRMFINAPEGWAPPFPEEGSLIYPPEEPEVGYYCCKVRIAPESRPGEYTIGCRREREICPSELEQCERLDDCGPWSFRSPICCCPWPCTADKLRVVPCVGDCERDGQVTVDEVQRGLLVAVGLEDSSTCAAADGNEDGQVTVDELVRSVRNVLSSCVETAREDREAATASEPTATHDRVARHTTR